MPNSSGRLWLYAALAGCALIVLVMLMGALVLFDKPQFGSLVGPNFMRLMISGMILGGVILLIAAINLPERRTWRGVIVMGWAIIAGTSPGFGYLFLIPWTVLVLSLPVVASILIRAYQRG